MQKNCSKRQNIISLNGPIQKKIGWSGASKMVAAVQKVFSNSEKNGFAFKRALTKFSRFIPAECSLEVDGSGFSWQNWLKSNLI